MPINDDIRAEKKKLKNMSMKEKLQYIWDYYRIPILVISLGMIMAIFIIKDVISNNRPTHLYACMLNSNYSYDNDTELINEYINYADIDTQAEQLILDFSMQIHLDDADQMSLAYQQKIMALFAADELDVLVGDEQIVKSYAEADGFANLEEFLPDDLKSELAEKGYSYYHYTSEDGGSVPIGLYMDSCKRLQEDGTMGTYPEDSRPIFTIAWNTPHPENSIEFLRFLISKD